MPICPISLPSYVHNDKQLCITLLLIDLHGAVGNGLDFRARLMLLPIKDITSPAKDSKSNTGWLQQA